MGTSFFEVHLRSFHMNCHKEVILSWAHYIEMREKGTKDSIDFSHTGWRDTTLWSTVNCLPLYLGEMPERWRKIGCKKLITSTLACFLVSSSVRGLNSRYSLSVNITAAQELGRTELWSLRKRLSKNAPPHKFRSCDSTKSLFSEAPSVHHRLKTKIYK